MNTYRYRQILIKQISSLCMAVMLIFIHTQGIAQPDSGIESNVSIGAVLSIRGRVTAINAEGDRRVLKRREPIFEGDTISTASRGRVRFRLRDNSMYVLQQNSTFEVSEFKFSGRADGTERANFNLTSGVLEFLSGIVGKRDPSRYRINTEYATIRLRGSGGIITLTLTGMQIFVTLGELTAVTKQGVTVILANGQTTVIRSDGSTNTFEGNLTGALQTLGLDVAAEMDTEEGATEQTTEAAAEIYADLLPDKAIEPTQGDFGEALAEALNDHSHLYAELVSVAIDAGLEPPSAAFVAISALGGSAVPEQVMIDIYYITTEGIIDRTAVEAAVIAAGGFPLEAQPTDVGDIRVGTGGTIGVTETAAQITTVTEICATVTSECQGASQSQ